MMSKKGYKNLLNNIDAYIAQYILKSHESFYLLLEFRDMVIINNKKKEN